jgi:hypothetical protein
VVLLPSLLLLLLQGLAQPRLVPTVLAVSQSHGAPGCHLIELDGVYVVEPHKPWFLPVTWLLPDAVPNNLHMKIGVDGSLEEGKVRRHVIEHLASCTYSLKESNCRSDQMCCCNDTLGQARQQAKPASQCTATAAKAAPPGHNFFVSVCHLSNLMVRLS